MIGTKYLLPPYTFVAWTGQHYVFLEKKNYQLDIDSYGEWRYR